MFTLLFRLAIEAGGAGTTPTTPARIVPASAWPSTQQLGDAWPTAPQVADVWPATVQTASGWGQE